MVMKSEFIIGFESDMFTSKCLSFWFIMISTSSGALYFLFSIVNFLSSPH